MFFYLFKNHKYTAYNHHDQLGTYPDSARLSPAVATLIRIQLIGSPSLGVENVWRVFGSKKHTLENFSNPDLEKLLASTWQLCRSKRYSSSYYDVQIPSWVGYCVPCATDVELGWMKCKIFIVSGRR